MPYIFPFPESKKVGVKSSNTVKYQIQKKFSLAVCMKIEIGKN